MTDLRVFDVILINEDGEPVLYDLAAPSARDAIIEAWRRYRELPWVDGEYPPWWTKARAGDALRRYFGEQPMQIGDKLYFADHILPVPEPEHA